MTAFLDLPADGFAAGADFWCRATGSTLSPLRGEFREFATLLPADGDPYLRVQRLHEGTGGLHLDFHIDDVPGTTQFALGLGAVHLGGEEGLAVMRSPGGFTFCLVQHQGESTRPRPLTWPGGHLSLADQICIDIPDPLFRSESEFWSALTGWPLRTDEPDTEFTHLDGRPDLPLHLLLQRLSPDDEGRTVRAHLDIASDGAVGAEVERHRGLGGRVVEPFPHWTVLSDPTGREYCVIRRGFDPGGHPST
jgi:hypothetical protein